MRLTISTFGPVDIESHLKNTLTCLVCLPAVHMNVSQENHISYKCLRYVLMCQSGNDKNQNGHLLCLASANFIASIIHVFY